MKLAEKYSKLEWTYKNGEGKTIPEVWKQWNKWEEDNTEHLNKLANPPDIDVTRIDLSIDNAPTGKKRN